MRITKIAARGLKGQSFEHELSPLVLISGRNFRGKTSRIEAIRLALMGYIPELGKTNAATWDLAADSSMEVRADLDDGGVVGRRFTLDRGSVKETALLPDGFTADIPLLNAEAYFGMSETDRINEVFRRVKMPDCYTAEKILADLRNIQLEENTQETEKARAKVVELASRALKDFGVADGLLRLVEDKGVLKSEFAAHNRRAKETIGTLRTLTELKAREGECSAETLAEIESQLATQSAELAKANRRAGELEAQARQARQQKERRELLERSLAVPAVDHSAEIAQANIDLNTQRAAINRTTYDENTLEELRSLKTCAEQALNEARSKLGRLTEQLEDLEKKQDQLAHLKACPFCQSKGKTWKASLQKTYGDEITGVSEGITEWRGIVEVAESTFANAYAHYENLVAIIQGNALAERKIVGLENQLERWKTEAEQDTARRESLRNELDAMGEPPEDNFEAQQACEAEIARIGETYYALDTKRKAALALAHDLKRAAEAAIEHNLAAAFVQIIKKAGERLKDLQGDMVAVAFRELLEIANTIVRNVLNSPLAFHEGEIGRWEGARFVKHRTFSGTEKAVTYVAIATALSANASPRIVILDELGRLDSENKRTVMVALRDALGRATIDQVVMIDTQAIESEGYQQIML